MATAFGPWALIVGGSEGVGASFARQLAAQGVHLVLTARNPGPLERTAASVRALGVEVRTVAGDVTAEGAVERVLETCGDCHVGTLICNAGASHGVATLLDRPLERALYMLRLNCDVPTRLVHHFGGLMRSRGNGGNIILVGSGAGMGGAAGIAAYSAAKAFVHNFAEALWCELKPLQIRVLCLVLGLTDTPAMARIGMHAGGGFTADDPDVVARTGLAEIANGPVFVMPSIRAYLESMRSLPRAEVAATMSRATQALMES